MKKRIIIAPAADKPEVFRLVLNQENDLMMGTEIVPFSVFKENLVPYLRSSREEFAFLFTAAQKTVSAENVYYDSLKFPAFFAYFYDFANELIELGIDPVTLPDDDRKEILCWLCSQDLRSRAINHAFNSIKDASDIEIYDCFYPDLKTREQLDFLVSRHASYLRSPLADSHQEEVRFAHNLSQETGSIAQYIIKEINNHKACLDDFILLVNDINTNAPVIEQILSLYNIPYSISRTSGSLAVQSFIALLKYLNEQTRDNFINVLNSGCFGQNSPELVRYINYLKLMPQQLMQPFDYVYNWDHQNMADTRMYDNMLKGELKAEMLMQPIREKLSVLNDSHTIRERTSAVFNMIKDSFSSDEEKVCLQQIRDICQETVPHLSDDSQAYQLLYYYLSSIEAVRAGSYSDSVLISDVYRDVNDRKTAVVISCSQNCFPETINKNGFFDEAYIRKIPDYPTLEKRTEYFNRQLEKLFKRMPHVIYSYSTNDLEGNKLYKSTFIDHIQEEKAWDYVEKNTYNPKETSIGSQLAERLYLADEAKIRRLKRIHHENYGSWMNIDSQKDKVLTVSPSSIESFVGCPFSYFLQKGLDVNPHDWFELGASVIGTIQHEALENYYRYSIDITATVNNKFSIIRNLFINDSDYLKNMEERLLTSLEMKVQYLDEAIAASQWKPAEYEKNIIKDKDYGSFKVIINGFIDRLDKSDNEFMIVDYKSSAKTINQESILNGTTIQLLTYLLAYSDLQDQLEPFGMAYFNLKNEFRKYEASKTPAETAHNKNRYTLYTVDGKKTDNPYYDTKRYSPDYQAFKKATDELIGIVTEKILSGDISITPSKINCSYCEFRDICHSFAGDDEPKREPLVSLEGE